MVTYDSRTYPTVAPYLYYEDGDAAIDWLVRVFGFRDRLRRHHPDGRFGHGEVEAGDGVVMLGTPDGFRRAERSCVDGPRHTANVHIPGCVAARRVPSRPRHTPEGQEGARIPPGGRLRGRRGRR